MDQICLGLHEVQLKLCVMLMRAICVNLNGVVLAAKTELNRRPAFNEQIKVKATVNHAVAK